MNLLDLEIKIKDGRYCLENETISYEISKDFYDLYLSKYNKNRLIISVRPSDIRIIPKPKKNSIQAMVTLVESRGSENHIHLSVGSSKMIVKTGVDVRPSIYNEINIFFKEENVYLFDIETGNSLKYTS
ncbi:TOBE domain-containing protein [Candidatus Bathyarchaeota archaeon]|nr:TOBE domain-containing protein [Candidatus Bathyarchaeota archaeon]